MTRAGNVIILEGGDMELHKIIEETVISTLNKVSHVNPDEKLTKDMIMKELNIGLTTYRNKVLSGKYPLKMYGTPKKLFAIRAEFEAWRRSDWGRY